MKSSTKPDQTIKLCENLRKIVESRDELGKSDSGEYFFPLLVILLIQANLKKGRE